MGPHDPIGAGEAPRRYSAFISYSHADAAFARRLHRDLETYRLPHKALARAGRGALANGRLKPVFRDADELTASSDLTQAVREALATSDHLIVVCSPNSAASPWVAREIELFRALHGDAGIVSALIDGEPEAAFPPALRGPARLEPLAADFRDSGTRRLALLKLVAVLAGVRLDELIQRDAQRRLRSVMLAAAASVAGIAVVAGISTAALEARRDADAQRARAGGLGEFMLSDLRKGLEAAGRHDLLAQVDQAALKSLSDKDLSRMTPDQLEQRAKALQAAGEDAEKKGDLKGAHADFDAALKTTTTLLAANPNDPKRLFADAQSKYWIGFINWRQGNGPAARAGLEAYARAADQLVKTDPTNDVWRMETAYAASNLGTLALRQAGDAAAAERYFNGKIAALRIILSHKPGDRDALKAMANGYAWLADSQRQQGDFQQALASRESELTILAALLAKDPRNAKLRGSMLGHDLAVARIDADRHSERRALREFEDGRRAAIELAANDPADLDYAKQARMFELFKIRMWLSMPKGVRPKDRLIAGTLGDCHQPGAAFSDPEISDFCATLLARLKADGGDISGARETLRPVLARAATEPNVLTAHWGINMAQEARPILIANSGGKSK